MIHEIALSDWKEDIAAIGFIVICMNNSTSLISGAALEDTTLSRSALKFVGNTKEKTAKELLDVRQKHVFTLWCIKDELTLGLHRMNSYVSQTQAVHGA
jgi:hypothetical protein